MIRKSAILIGFMGSGKTTVGRILAELLGAYFIEMDAEIEKKEGKSIPRIFSENGESYFRKLEAELCIELADKEGVVISTGGGVVLNRKNIVNLRKIGPIVWLDAEPETIYERIIGDGKEKRPLLDVDDPMEEIKRILNSRRELYENSADIRIITDGKSPEEIAREIIKKLEEFRRE